MAEIEVKPEHVGDPTTRHVGLDSLRRTGSWPSAACLAVLAACAALAANGPADSRVEARSADLLAVGVVHGDRMSIHVSRLTDNAPVRDAVVTVSLRGVTHPAVAEADGSYEVEATDLAVPGTAAVVFEIVQSGGARFDLPGTLEVASGRVPDEKNGARQLWWWVLNFAVCGGFLMLLSRRRQRAPDRGDS